ncbi:transcription factor [Schizosaccharomyces japonicus yFS275]|uniref:Transcription factor n=1 Tax=Schizosaccharomyces japonicus (strain yFS275 / FY16936) TaxID=402676 RepID=B6K7U0_SCHJY|nr:transcription factor [Schizosaccharomyces japonicus yFS275]EEB09594.1 transcription factor [Schizosaccharomyces japonicus yFS275]
MSSSNDSSLTRRQRVLKACDECHRKKVKCDGQRPCSHCVAYNYECTFGQPFKRLRNMPEKYVQFLELRLKFLSQLAQAKLPNFKPGVPGSASSAQGNARSANAQKKVNVRELETLFDRYGQLSLQDDGSADFRGNSSGFVFMKNIRDNIHRFPTPKDGSNEHLPFTTPKVTDEKPYRYLPPMPSEDLSSEKTMPHIQLPSYEEARNMVNLLFLNDHFLVHFHHIPSFFSQLKKFYQTGCKGGSFHSLLVSTLCVAYMYVSSSEDSSCFHRAYEYYVYLRCTFQWGDCYSIEAVQTLLSISLFALFSSRLSQAYTIIDDALLCCHELGLHRELPSVPPQEARLCKRIFWSVYVMASYVSTILGLPFGIEDEDIDQGLPTVFETNVSLGNTPPVLIASEAMNLDVFVQHVSLARILSHFVRKVYPIDMGSVPREMIFYRPFLHYIESANEQSTEEADESHMFALSCAKSAERVVVLLNALLELTPPSRVYSNLYAGYYSVMTLTLCATFTKTNEVLHHSFIQNAKTGYAALNTIYRNIPYGSTILDALNEMLQEYDFTAQSQRSIRADNFGHSNVHTPIMPVSGNQKMNTHVQNSSSQAHEYPTPMQPSYPVEYAPMATQLTNSVLSQPLVKAFDPLPPGNLQQLPGFQPTFGYGPRVPMANETTNAGIHGIIQPPTKPSSNASGSVPIPPASTLLGAQPMMPPYGNNMWEMGYAADYPPAFSGRPLQDGRLPPSISANPAFPLSSIQPFPPMFALPQNMRQYMHYGSEVYASPMMPYSIQTSSSAATTQNAPPSSILASPTSANVQTNNSIGSSSNGNSSGPLSIDATHMFRRS